MVLRTVLGPGPWFGLGSDGVVKFPSAAFGRNQVGPFVTVVRWE